jgi:hypothetical protein
MKLRIVRIASAVGAIATMVAVTGAGTKWR